MELHEIDELMDRATEDMMKYGILHAKWRALSYELQKGEKHILALLTMKSEAKSHSARETEAEASSDYTEHINKAAEALQKEVLALHKLEHAKAIFEKARSRMSMAKMQWERP